MGGPVLAGVNTSVTSLSGLPAFGGQDARGERAARRPAGCRHDGHRRHRALASQPTRRRGEGAHGRRGMRGEAARHGRRGDLAALGRRAPARVGLCGFRMPLRPAPAPISSPISDKTGRYRAISARLGPGRDLCLQAVPKIPEARRKQNNRKINRTSQADNRWVKQGDPATANIAHETSVLCGLFAVACGAGTTALVGTRQAYDLALSDCGRQAAPTALPSQPRIEAFQPNDCGS